MFFLPFHWMLEQAEQCTPVPPPAHSPCRARLSPPSQLCGGLLNLVFARLVPGIASSKLASGGLILSFFEEVRPLLLINRMLLTRLGSSRQPQEPRAFTQACVVEDRGAVLTQAGALVLALLDASWATTLSEPPFLPFKKQYTKEDCFEE